jgi:signal transduction histidine kinase
VLVAFPIHRCPRPGPPMDNDLSLILARVTPDVPPAFAHAPAPSPGFVAAIPKPLAWMFVLIPTAFAAAQNIDAAAVLGLLTTVGVGLAGLYVMVRKQITQAHIDAKRAWDEANKGSLAVQMEELNVNLEKARHSLHELRNEAAEREAHLQDEIETLKGELTAAREELHQLRPEYRRLLELIATTERRTTVNTQRISTLEDKQASSDAIPTHKPPHD